MSCWMRMQDKNVKSDESCTPLISLLKNYARQLITNVTILFNASIEQGCQQAIGFQNQYKI